MENMELNLKEMEEIVGGKGGSKTPLKPTPQYDVYKIQTGDTLTRIAYRFNTTVDFLVKINPTITNANDITAGYYMFVPKK